MGGKEGKRGERERGEGKIGKGEREGKERRGERGKQVFSQVNVILGACLM